MGLIIALSSAILLALANLTLKRSFKNFSPAVGFFFFAIFSAVIWSSVALILGVRFEFFWESLLYGLISAVLAQAFYIYALSKGELSITGTILATFPIYTIIFSFFVNGETLTRNQAIFAAVTILGTVVIAIPEKLSREDIVNTKYLLLPLLAAISIGFADSTTKKIIDASSPGTFLLGTAIMQLPVSLVFLKLMREKFSQFKTPGQLLQDYRPALLGAFLVCIHTMTLFIAFDFAPAAIVAPIVGGLAPALTVAFSLLVLKERVSFKDMLAIAMILAGVIGISVL
jgi:drug/metabolite transporter (DMT)-like permease